MHPERREVFNRKTILSGPARLAPRRFRDRGDSQRDGRFQARVEGRAGVTYLVTMVTLVVRSRSLLFARV